jgi:hypothetical protein
LAESLLSSSEYQWCRGEFAAVELQDARLNDRCSELAVQLAMQPQGPINQACEDWADTKAAYRFFDNDKATPERIRAPHQQRTVERMAQYERVLAIQDTTFLNCTCLAFKQSVRKCSARFRLRIGQAGLLVAYSAAL